MYNPDGIPLFQMQPIIPSVLQQPKGNSLSTVRVLKAAIELIEAADFPPDSELDRLKEVNLSDLKDMLRRVW